MTDVPKRVNVRPVSVPRMLQVLRMIAEGKTNAAIGRELGISEQTVKGRVRTLFDDLGARDRAHAVALGYQRGLLSLGNHAPTCPLRGSLVCRCKSGVDR